MINNNGNHNPIRGKEKKVESKENSCNNNGNVTSLAITPDSNANYLDQVITNYLDKLQLQKTRFLGYQTNQELECDALSSQLLHFHINNVGDPFFGSGYTLNSTQFEVSVLDWFAKLWEIEKGDYWGYVTTGGTEGNLHGILLGREKFPDGILYASKDSHYSVFKIARVCRMKCVKVGTLASGEIDCVDLKALLLAHKDQPAIVNLNIGTTMKGAVDDIDLVIQTLESSGFSRDRFYIHCDGALFGIMLPFVKTASKIASFKKGIGSMSVSGHKFIGCPIPCGVVITRKEHMKALSRDVDYIGSSDATITGSRSGHAPIFLWYALQKKGLDGMEKQVRNCMTNARYLLDGLRKAGVGAMLNDLSNTVVFERPWDDEFVRRWSLSCSGKLAHVVVMQHVTLEILRSFLTEFLQMRSLWFGDGLRNPPCIAHDIGAINCACAICTA